MLVFIGQRFKFVQKKCLDLLVDTAPSVGVGEWQSQDVRDRPEMVTRELTNVSLELSILDSVGVWAEETGCNLPWAEDHFLERVSGIPHNPPPSEAYWPFAVRGNEDHKHDQVFSHTYPERFWPKKANGRVHSTTRGIRYPYGDLADVVKQLEENPLTRQAYLPVWFPEDTGAVHKERVPCTLGYHFLVRENALQVTYFIRSCDALRHWPDDVYMAGRLAQWVADQLNTSYDADQHLGYLVPGKLVMHIGSLHIFEGDLPRLEYERGQQA